MVKGLDVFRRHFAGHSDHFILIGGTAATLAMEEAGLDFRATKDVDIVLQVEVLDPDFAGAFWEFVRLGRYEIQERSDTGTPAFYRFRKPGDDQFPHMLELFSRSPDGIPTNEGSRLTPIPVDEAISSLSAILLDEAYYAFVVEGRRVTDGLPWVGADRLIPLKASAWLNLSARRERGEQVDSRDIRKHANDVLRLSQLLAPQDRFSLPPSIAEDLWRFLEQLAHDESISPKALGLSGTTAELAERIARAYVL